MKILVVDDDRTNRVVLKGFLDKQNHHVILAENGKVAVEKFETEAPDLILMDMVMPVMDGLEATRIIKEKCSDHFVPIIFLTAMAEASNLAECIESGGDDYMSKPYNHVVLSAKIEALTRIRELYQTVHTQKQELAIYRENNEQSQQVAEKVFANITNRGDLDLSMINYSKNPAETFNGDIVLVARNPLSGLNILVGDFTGHGLAAAIGAMPVSDIFYGMSAKGFGIQKMLPELNMKLRQTLPLGRFLAAVLIQLDAKGRYLTVWNGGMPDVLVFEHNDWRVTKTIESTRLPLGVVDNVSLETETTHLELKKGDRVYIYSDGVIEQGNEQNEMFGMERLLSILNSQDINDNIVEKVKCAVDVYRKEKAQTDDVTLLELVIDPDALAKMQDEQMPEGLVYQATQWNFQLEFFPDTLQRIDPLPIIVQVITNVQGLASHRENLFVILSELFNNAFDHGLLELDSTLKIDANGFSIYYNERENRLKNLKHGYIRLNVSHRPLEIGGELVFRMEDSGKGFSVEKLNLNLATNSGHSGRGIPLIKSLCNDLRFLGNGNTVEVVYQWK